MIRMTCSALAAVVAFAGCAGSSPQYTPAGGSAAACPQSDAGSGPVARDTDCSGAAQPLPSSDPGYRVVVGTPGSQLVGLSPNTAWTLQYKFTVPPLPCAANWSDSKETLYVWGDVDFDQYGSAGPHSLSSYVYNQIVPQLILGNAQSGNTATYQPTGHVYSTWRIEATYYWQSSDGTGYTEVGPVEPVSVGDEVTSVIAYDPGSGAVNVTISTPNVSSSLSLPRPFLNETPALFSSWAEFFTQASAKEGNGLVLGRPVVNVESHYMNQDGVCSLLPFQVDGISFPGVTANACSFAISQDDSLSCSGPLALLRF